MYEKITQQFDHWSQQITTKSFLFYFLKTSFKKNPTKCFVWKKSSWKLCAFVTSYNKWCHCSISLLTSRKANVHAHSFKSYDSLWFSCTNAAPFARYEHFRCSSKVQYLVEPAEDTISPQRNWTPIHFVQNTFALCITGKMKSSTFFTKLHFVWSLMATALEIISTLFWYFELYF